MGLGATQALHVCRAHLSAHTDIFGSKSRNTTRTPTCTHPIRKDHNPFQIRIGISASRIYGHILRIRFQLSGGDPVQGRRVETLAAQGFPEAEIEANLPEAGRRPP